MTKYKIKQTSSFLWIISMFAIIFAGIAIIIVLAVNGLFPAGQTWLVFVIIAPIFFLAFKVPPYTSTVDIELTIDEQGLKKKWLKQFIFSNNPDLDIKWSEIEDFVFEPDRQFDKFKMTLKDGTKFNFFHNRSYNDKDDFTRFLKDFELTIKQINSDKDESNDIKRGKTIYETNWGVALAVLAIFMIIAVPIIFIFFPADKAPNYGSVIILYSSAFYFLFQFYTYRRKN